MPSSIPALTHPSAPPPNWRIALNLLDQNPHQPRSQMDDGALGELMASVRDHVERVAREVCGDVPEETDQKGKEQQR